MKPSVSIVVPFLNESENLTPLYERLKPQLQEHAADYEILFVDDGSTDDSVQRLLAIREEDPGVKLVSLSRNYGHQLALTAGLDYASGDVVITMDADLQHPPEELPRFLEKWREGFDIVHGAKTAGGKRGLVKSCLAGMYYGLMQRISGVRIVPHASDYRLLSRRAAAGLRSMRENTRFLRGLVNWMGFRSTVLEYAPDARHAGRPKYSLRRLATLGLSGILSFSTTPLRFSTYVGFFVGFLSLVYAGYAVYARVFLGEIIEGWASLMVVLLFLGSVQLVSLGIIGEYLGRIFEESKRRPLYLVSQTTGIDRSPAAP